jgi:putative transposase
LPPNLLQIIKRFGRENPTWGEDRIADERLVKFGIRVSPRTVSKYLGSGRPHVGRRDQRWATFVRNHAKAVVACDFFVSVSATIRVFYVFVACDDSVRRASLMATKKILMLVGDYVEDYEVMVPFQALLMVAFHIVLLRR